MEDQLLDNYLSEERWRSVAPVLAGKDGDPGCSGRDNRLFLKAVFWIARTGSAWRNRPPRFGKWYTIYTRYHRWEQKGVWPRVIAALSQDGACDFKYDGDGLHWTPLSGTPLSGFALGKPAPADRDAFGESVAA